MELSVGDGYRTIGATGLVLPVASDAAELHHRLVRAEPVRATGRPDEVAGTELAADLPVSRLDPDTDLAAFAKTPPGMPRESMLACSAAMAVHQAVGPRYPVGTVWASSTAGLAEYGGICVDAAVLGPGLARPFIGPLSAFNGPCAAVAMRLGLTGPSLTLSGGRAAGAAAFAEAVRMTEPGSGGAILVGASADVSAWRLPAAEPPLVPAEGAVCVLLSAAPPQEGDVVARLLGRVSLDPAEMDRRLPGFVDQWTARMRRRPEVVVLSAGANGHRLAGSLMDRAGPACHHLEAVAGDLGTVGGLLAVVSAATACRLAGPAGAAALALAVSGAGDVIAVELNVG